MDELAMVGCDVNIQALTLPRNNNFTTFVLV